MDKIRRLIVLFMCTVFFLSGCAPLNTDTNAPDSENSSAALQTTVIEEQEYYLIRSESELASIGKSSPLSGSYVLDCDITLTEEWQPIGDADDPFTGTFDGNGYTVSNLTVTKEYKNMGFFGASERAVIRNLVVEDAHILENSHMNIGPGFAIVGYAKETEITNCSVNQSK